MSRLYRERFDESDLEFKQKMWQVLCDDFFQAFVKESDTVLDLGAGRCEFINAISCASKIAVDLNPDVALYARDARVVQASSTDLSAVESGSVDVVFSSNFLEHLIDKNAVLKTLEECGRVTRPAGSIILLGPNIRYLGGRYWDYFDHHTPLTHASLAEGLTSTGWVPNKIIPRFLPYTVKGSHLPKSIALLRLYLRMPLVWPLVGKQMLVFAQRGEEP